jgi:flagellar motor switch protein FliN/FliY
VGIDAASDDDCRSTWHEIIGQTMGGIATSLTADARREITTVSGEEIPVEPESLPWLVFEVRQGSRTYTFRAAWLPIVGAQIESGAQVAQDRANEDSKQSATAANNAFSKTFDLLLDVALPVSVSFGRTSLQIREVLKLNTGSIVELDRLVIEPVEVIVNDCVIARGEVVVVDGNYGVRVTQLASREDRLRFGISQTSARVAAGAGGAA